MIRVYPYRHTVPFWLEDRTGCDMWFHSLITVVWKNQGYYYVYGWWPCPAAIKVEGHDSEGCAKIEGQGNGVVIQNYRQIDILTTAMVFIITFPWYSFQPFAFWWL